jgi:hypothetical protein
MLGSSLGLGNLIDLNP